jgi:hypothetical protein
MLLPFIQHNGKTVGEESRESRPTCPFLLILYYCIPCPLTWIFNLLYKRRGTRQPESSRSAALYMRQEEVRSVGAAAAGVAIEQPTKYCTLLYYPQSINNTRIRSKINAILAILITISNHLRIFSLTPSLLLQHWKDLPYNISIFFVN